MHKDAAIALYDSGRGVESVLTLMVCLRRSG